jgi:hypothetical protein
MAQNSVNAPNYKIDQTVRIFDTFYTFEAIVPSNEYDAVYGFFSSIMASATAGNFTVTLFRVAQESGIPVTNLLTQLSGKNAVEVNAELAYYLNGLQSLNTLVGINALAQPNYYAARNVAI